MRGDKCQPTAIHLHYHRRGIGGPAGPIYSLGVKAGWKGTISGLDGIGWIALSITIFGGWNPMRAAIGAYLFAFFAMAEPGYSTGSTQHTGPGAASGPVPIDDPDLMLVNISDAEWVARTLAGMPESTRKVVARILRAMHASPPASLGVPFEVNSSSCQPLLRHSLITRKV